VIAGQVGGDVSALSGNIDLAETAEIDGDVSVVNGQLTRARGAEVDGELVRGRGADENTPPERPEPPGPPRGAPSFFGWLANLLLRLILAVILSAVVVTLVTLLHHLRPDILRPIYAVMIERTAFSFIVGLLVNLVLAILTVGLFATVILCLGGVMTGVLLVGLNLVGWAVVAQYLGQRLTQFINTPIRPITSTLLGVIVLTSLTAILWALGGCFQFLGFLLWLGTSSVGVGAAVVHWLKLGGRTLRPSIRPAEGGLPPPDRGPAPTAPPNAPVPTVAADEPLLPMTLPPEPPISIVPVNEESISPAVTSEVDFTIIRGVGPTFDRRLKAAGIHTFAQLAASTPDEIAPIIGWTPQRVINDDIIGQAQRLSEQ
jgi:hypothetical protein